MATGLIADCLVSVDAAYVCVVVSICMQFLINIHWVMETGGSSGVGVDVRIPILQTSLAELWKLYSYVVTYC